jgi:hypothetical protein
VPSARRYFDELVKRSKTSHVYRKHQLDGLEIADLLGDRAHKSLYIKLAKERNADELRALAREIADKKTVKNKGAYFMAVLTKKAPQTPKKSHGRKRHLRHKQ